MAEEVRHADGRIEHPGVRFENTDASFGAIVAILIGTIASLVVIQVGVYAFFHYYGEHLAEVGRSPYPLAAGPSLSLPREPRLEQLDRLPPWPGEKGAAGPYDKAAAKLRALDGYETAEEGFVHVPIERAMQWVVEKNMLKARSEPAADQRARGLVDAGESNSGRVFRGERK